MDEYKKSVESQHAPEALIQSTLRRIHEEDAKMPENLPEKKIRRFPVTAVAGMAAAFLLLLGVTQRQSGNDFYYNQVTDSIIKAESGIDLENFVQEIPLKDYEEYAGIVFADLFADGTLMQSEIEGSYSEEELTEDSGTFYYEMDGIRFMVQTSKSVQIAPKELTTGESSQIGEVDVYLGEISENERYVAAFEQNGISYYVVGNNVDKKDFEKILKKMKPLAK